MSTSASRPRSLATGALAGALLLAVTGLAAPTAAAAARPHHVQRVSTAADGTQADKASGPAALTANGRFVAFRSAATNLVPEPGHGAESQSYVRDLRTGAVSRVDEALSVPSLSAGGRWAATIGWGGHDIGVFLTDRATGTRTKIDGAGFRESAYQPSISADGRFVAFQFVPYHPSIPTRVDVYDRITGGHETVSDGPQDAPARDMSHPSISADGRLVAYQDDGAGEVWVADRRTGRHTRVDDGARSGLVQLSADGRTVAMSSADGAYARDLRTGRVQRFPKATARAVSPDGRRLLYADARAALRIRDLRTGADRVVVAASEAAGAGAGALSERSLVFSSAAPDLVPGDTNGVADVFVSHPR
ncbi:protein TolB [Streptomyces sp. NPDC048324]|uniref:TolB family protein n=1 Tax=Streptomyces sp. NPDC048324 TaxID=3157205 RepID=UPI0034181DD8